MYQKYINIPINYENSYPIKKTSTRCLNCTYKLHGGTEFNLVKTLVRDVSL